jgi:hypothetical protein
LKTSLLLTPLQKASAAARNALSGPYHASGSGHL